MSLALRLNTGTLQYADVFASPADLMAIPKSDIKNLYTILAVAGGNIVQADEDLCRLRRRPCRSGPTGHPLYNNNYDRVVITDERFDILSRENHLGCGLTA
jgi:hypothetical protein